MVPLIIVFPINTIKQNKIKQDKTKNKKNQSSTLAHVRLYSYIKPIYIGPICQI